MKNIIIKMLGGITKEDFKTREDCLISKNKEFSSKIESFEKNKWFYKPISLNEFIEKKPIIQVYLDILEKKFKKPQTDAHETLYVICKQCKNLLLLNTILKEEYPDIDKSNYIDIAKELFNEDDFQEYKNSFQNMK